MDLHFYIKEGLSSMQKSFGRCCSSYLESLNLSESIITCQLSFGILGKLQTDGAESGNILMKAVSFRCPKPTSTA